MKKYLFAALIILLILGCKNEEDLKYDKAKFLLELATEKNNEEYCNLIEVQTIKENCRLRILMAGNFSNVTTELCKNELSEPYEEICLDSIGEKKISEYIIERVIGSTKFMGSEGKDIAANEIRNKEKREKEINLTLINLKEKWPDFSNKNLHEIITIISTIAKTKPNEAENMCSEFIISQMKDGCYYNIAEATNSHIYCALITDYKTKDRCLSMAAKTSQNKSACLVIGENRTRDNCLWHFVISEDFDNCSLFTNHYYKESCEINKNLSIT